MATVTSTCSSASYGDGKIAWYENDGSQNFSAHTIGGGKGAVNVFVADVDGDGDTDVLSATYGDHQIAWYENDGSQNFYSRLIRSNAYGALNVYAADVDGDGDTDALSSSSFTEPPYKRLAWYMNDGHQNFSAYTIASATPGHNSVFAADVDGDGDLDALSASQDNKIAWYENAPARSTGFGGTGMDDPTKIPIMPAPPQPGPSRFCPGVIVRQSAARFAQAEDETSAELWAVSAIPLGLASRLSAIKRLADVDWPSILGDALPRFGEG